MPNEDDRTVLEKYSFVLICRLYRKIIHPMKKSHNTSFEATICDPVIFLAKQGMHAGSVVGSLSRPGCYHADRSIRDV